MCSRNSAENTGGRGRPLGARERKIKGRGTVVRASAGLHMVFGGTPMANRASNTTQHTLSPLFDDGA
jgi:hypothetical protein